MVGTEEKDSVFMSGIARDRVRYGVKNVIVGEPVAASTAQDPHLSIVPPNLGGEGTLALRAQNASSPCSLLAISARHHRSRSPATRRMPRQNDARRPPEMSAERHIGGRGRRGGARVQQAGSALIAQRSRMKRSARSMVRSSSGATLPSRRRILAVETTRM